VVQTRLGKKARLYLQNNQNKKGFVHSSSIRTLPSTCLAKFKSQNWLKETNAVVHASHPNYLGGTVDRRIMVQGQPRQKARESI
jgi:hypothetical protein